MPLSYEQKEHIKNLWDTGLSYRQIASATQITVGAVAGLCHRMGWKRGPTLVQERPLRRKPSKPEKPHRFRQRKIDTSDIPEVNEDWFKMAVLKEPAAPLPVGEVDFLQLASHQCKWPMDKYGGEYNLMIFCGALRCSPKSPYCQLHANIAGRLYRR